MADTVLDSLRSKYPQYKDVPDDKLTLAIGQKYPQYLKNKEFSADFGRLSQPAVTAPTIATPPQSQPSPSGLIGKAWQWAITPISAPAPTFSTPETEQEQKIENEPYFKSFEQKSEQAGKPASTAGKVWLGAREGAAALAESFRSPLGIATLGIGSLPRLLQRAIALGFAAQMARQTPEIARQLGAEFGKPAGQSDPEKIANLMVQGGGNIIMAGLAAAHGIAPTKISPVTKGVPNASKKFSPAEVHGDLQSPPVSGEGQVPLTQSSGGVQPQAEAVAKEAQVPLEQVNLTGLEPGTGKPAKKAAARPTAKTSDIIAPEHQQMLDIERGNVDVPVDVLSEKEIADAEKSDDPFAQKKGEVFRNGIATVDRENKRIVINPKKFSAWLNKIPANQRQMAVRSLITGEERIHGATSDAAARAYAGTLTGLERAVHARMYLGPKPKDAKGAKAWQSIADNDTLLGHEAIAFRLQQLMKLTPRTLAEAVGREKWTMKSLAVLESTVRGIRETLGTKASREAIAILDTIDDRIKLGQFIAAGASPGAVDKRVQDDGEKEAQKLEEQAQMYLESGDAESADELKAMAAKLRGQTGEQYFPGAHQKFERQDYSPEDLERYKSLRARTVPSTRDQLSSPQFQRDWQDFENLRNKYGGMPPKQLAPAQEHFPGARPKKRHESVFQENFILPGMETKWSPEKGMIAPLKFGSQSEHVPESERTSAEASGALPRLPEEEIHSRAATWIASSIQDALAASDRGERAKLPTFKDFTAYMKKQAPHYQQGRLFEMWQNYMTHTFEDMSGADLQKLGKGTFGQRTSLESVERIAKAPTEEERFALQPAKEAGASIWNRPVADKPGPDSVITAFNNAEQNLHKAEMEQRDLAGLEGAGKATEKVKDAKHEVVKLKKAYEEAMRAQSWRKRVISALYRKAVKESTEESDARLERKTITPEELRYGGAHDYEDISKAPTDTGAFRDMLSDSSRRSNEDPASVTRRVVTLLNERSGTVHIVSAYEHPGTVEEVTPQGKTKVKDIRVVDPISPTKESVPLRSIANRYKILYTALLDEPVRKFRQDFKSLSDYNERFGKEAAQRAGKAASYEPLQISEAEFMEAGGGRIAKGEGGSFQGPYRNLVQQTYDEADQARRDAEVKAGGAVEPYEGGWEETAKKPIKDAEAEALMNHIQDDLGGDVSSASAVADAIDNLKDSKSRQAKSAALKLIRQIAMEYPFATGDELVDKLADRIYEAHKSSRSMEEFQRKLGVSIPKPELDEPSKTGRELTTLRSRAPTTTSKQLPPQYFPGAKPKVPNEEKTIARILWDSLFQLTNSREADFRDKLPELRSFGEELDKLPPMSASKASDKLDEEVVLGKSDIKLTPNEQKIYDVMANEYAQNKQKEAYLKDKDPNTPTQYFPRILADPNSIFERVMRGVKSYATEGTVMGSTASFLKARKIRALTDFEGNRRVVVIVGKGDKARLVAYDKGQAEDLGPYAFKDIQRRGDRLQEELAPINKAADVKIMKLNLLKSSGKRAEASKRLISQLEKELADLFEQAENIAAKYPDPLQDVRTWMDKSGKEWKFGEATRREIESNMKARFYRNAYPALVSQGLKLDQLIRQHEWMEDFKNSEAFKQIASVGDQPGRPTDWRLTEVPQLKGIWFHPRVTDVLDQFQENANRGDWNAWRNMNRALQGALFLNQPFLHDPNLLTWWFATRGASAWLNPRAYPRMYHSFQRAFNDVLSKNGDYTNYLRLGTPLQLKVMHDFGDRMTDMLKDQLEGNPPLAKRIANILGFANPIHLMNTIGRAATEGLHDILTLQLIHELEERGLSPHEALRKVTAVMPDRRIPPRVLGSRWLSKLMADGSIMWFAAYHYAEGRAFKNMVKGVAGNSEELSRAEALDKIAAIALLMFAAYPAIDSLVKAVTGKNYALRRAGPTTWPSAIADVAAGRKTPAMAIPSFVSLSPLFTAIPSLFANRNLMNRGLPIYNPRAPYAQQAADIAKFAGQTVNPIQMYGDLINGRTTLEDIALNLIGVRKDYANEPYNKIYGWAYDWAKETGNHKLLNRFNQEANEVYPPSVYSNLKQALEDGNDARARKEVAKLKATGKTDAELERELRPSAHPLSGLKEFDNQFYESLTSEQRQVYDQEVSNRELIYQRYLDLGGQ